MAQVPAQRREGATSPGEGEHQAFDCQTASGACAATGRSHSRGLEKERLTSYGEVRGLPAVAGLHSPNQRVGTGSQPQCEQAQGKSPAELSIPFLIYNPATETRAEAASFCNCSNVLVVPRDSAPDPALMLLSPGVSVGN